MSQRLHRTASARMARLARSAFALAALVAASCSTDPPTEPLVAVVSVSIGGVPADGVLLSGVSRDLTATVVGSGDVVLAREVRWSSSDTSIATVSDRGTVETGRVGEATVSASSEFRSATVDLSVREGTTVQSGGGSRTSNHIGNRLRLILPSGVAPAGTVIHVRQALVWPPSPRIVEGSVMEIGPAGTELASNITVGITYVPTEIPAAERSLLRLWAVQADGQWALLPNASVDQNNSRVNAGLMRLTKVAIFRAGQ